MEPYVTVAVSEAIAALIGALVAGIIVSAKTNAKRASEEMRSIKRGLRAILRKEIVDAYTKFVVEGQKMSLERYEEIEKSFEAYEGLGGNGTAKKLFEEIRAKRPWIVME